MKWIVAVFVGSVCAVAVPADGLGEEKSEKERVAESTDGGAEEAQGLFERGYEAYSKKDYGKAMRLWRRAYEIVPEATFLYNAANAAEKLGNLEQALGLARRAKKQEERALPQNLQKKNEKLISRVEKRQAYRANLEDYRAAQKLDWRGWSGIAGLALGAAGVGVGTGVFGNRATHLRQKLQRAESRDVYDRRRSRFQRAQQRGRILLYSGIGVGLAGGGMIAWDVLDLPAKPAQPQFSFGIGRGGARMGLRVNF